MFFFELERRTDPYIDEPSAAVDQEKCFGPVGEDRAKLFLMLRGVRTSARKMSSPSSSWWVRPGPESKCKWPDLWGVLGSARIDYVADLLRTQTGFCPEFRVWWRWWWRWRWCQCEEFYSLVLIKICTNFKLFNQRSRLLQFFLFESWIESGPEPWSQEPGLKPPGLNGSAQKVLFTKSILKHIVWK